MQPQTRTIPEFNSKEHEAEYWHQCEQRGRAVLFWIICGSNMGGLALAENDAAALWSVQWDELPSSQRQHLCLSLARFPLAPNDLQQSSMRYWKNLSDGVRAHVCAYSPKLAAECRHFLRKNLVGGVPVLLQEQAQ